MKKTLRFFSSVFLAALLVAGCSSGSSTPDTTPTPPLPPPTTSALEPGGAGLAIDQLSDGQGGTLEVNFTAALDINDNLEVVGFAEVNPGTPFVPALWRVDAAGAPSVAPAELSPLIAGGFAAAFAIDENGNVVGQADNSSRLAGVVWNNNGVPTALPALAVTGNYAAYGLSADGRLIVGEATDASGDIRAVIWTANSAGEFASAPAVLPFVLFARDGNASSYGTATGVARVGAGIWVAGEVEAGNGVMRAALWRSTDGVVFNAADLGNADEAGSAAFAVSQGGVVTGESLTVAGGTVPVRWVLDGTTFARTNLAGGGSAVAVNNSNRIAGWSGEPDQATVWSGTLPTTLFTTLSHAYGLNNDQQPVVVGRNGNEGFVKRVN